MLIFTVLSIAQSYQLLTCDVSTLMTKLVRNYSQNFSNPFYYSKIMSSNCRGDLDFISSNCRRDEILTVVFIDLNFDLGIILYHRVSECELKQEDRNRKNMKIIFGKMFHKRRPGLKTDRIVPTWPVSEFALLPI